MGKQQIFAAEHIDNHRAVCKRGGGFNRIRQAAADFRRNHQAVHHNLDIVFVIFFQFDFFRQIIKIAVHTHAHKAGPARRVQFFLMFAFSPADDRRHNLDFRALFHRKHAVHDAVHRLADDFPPANRAMRNPDARIQKAQVVVNFRHRSDGGTRVFGGGFLVNGNCRGKPVNRIDIRFFHLP